MTWDILQDIQDFSVYTGFIFIEWYENKYMGVAMSEI
jgi:hypothetical protein